MAASFSRYLSLSVSIVISGWLALKLAVPPGYASPLWPPAGIGVAALLIWGNGGWPALWTGALILELGLFYQEGHVSWAALACALAIASGGTLQAWFGAWCSRCWLGPGVPRLDEAGKILLYAMLTGPLACLTSASVGTLALWCLGVFDEGTVLFSWWNWWIGDSLGVIIISPILFCWFAQPATLWRGRLWAVALPLAAMLAGFCVIFVLAIKAENSRLQLQFDNIAAAVNKALAERFTHVLGDSFALNSFFRASNQVEAKSFAVFAGSVLARNPNIHALEWVPLIAAAQRPAFEQAMRRQGVFAIWQQAPNGDWVTADGRPEYFPVMYSSSIAGHRKAIGFDLGSEATLKQGFDAARAHRDLIVIQRLDSELGAGPPTPELQLIMPLYRAGPEAEPQLSGFTLVALGIDNVVDSALNGLMLDGLNVAIRDPRAPESTANLYGTLNTTRAGLSEFRQLFLFGDRLLEIVVEPEQAFASARVSWLPWSILLGGLFFTGLLNVYLLSATGRSAVIEELVEKRTAELDTAYASLRNAYRHLADKEQKLRDLYELSPLGIALRDMQGRFIEFNDAFRKIVGYSSEELSALDYKLLTPEKYANRQAEQWQALAETGRYGPFEKEYIHKDGHLVPVELNSVKVKTVDGADYIWSIVEDIGKAKANEDILRQSELKYRELFNVSHDAVMMLDRNGFLDCNQATLALFGYDSVAAMCQLHPAVVSPPRQPDGGDSFELASEQIEAAIVSGYREFEWLHRRADGSTFPALIALSRISLNGVVALQAVIRDLSEQKRVEQALIAAKDAAEATAKFKSDFLANMSHEIRTPMNAIIGLSQLALNQPVSDEVRDKLWKIHSCSESLLGILNDILDFSKLEAGKFGIATAVFDLSGVLETLRNLFSGHAEQKKLWFRIEADPDIPRALVGDALRLQQILSNLLGNAIKFSQRGGVTLQLQLVGANASEARIRFGVHDTGIGISKAELAKLFQPFSQVDASVTRHFGGTGLGLAISQELLHLMGGEFAVESSTGIGTSFSFELRLGIATDRAYAPAERPMMETGQLAAQLSRQGAGLKGARILLAEDNPINQQLATEFMRLAGIDVDIANNGREALDRLTQCRYDAILMDVQMPEMSGIEATRLIRAQARHRQLPIIALTAGVTQEEREKYLACGMNGFVAKPIDPRQLVRVLCEAIAPNTAVELPEAAQTALPPSDRLHDLPGFDFENVLVLVGGDEDLLLEMLGGFKTRTEAMLGEIDVLCSQRDFLAAHRLLHSLIGTAGNLGAYRLQAAATTLGAQLKQNRADSAAYAEFQAVARDALNALERLV